MKRIVQTLNNQVFFEFNKNTWLWKYKSKNIIKDQKIIDTLNQIWYNKHKGSQSEIFVNFREFEAIRKFIENNKINGGM